MKLKFKSHYVFIFLVIVVSIILYVRLETTTRIEKTFGKNREEIKQLLEEHLVFVSLENGRVHFVSDGKLGIDWGKSAENPWTTDFSLKKSESFFAYPDKHGSSEFKVLDISPNYVEIEYLNEFDHQSFGKNLISIDTGTVKLSYKE